MGLYRRKRNGKLKRNYDERLLTLMNKQKKMWEHGKQLEAIVVDEHPEGRVQQKIQQAKYFYLFKEARIRKIEGNYLN